MMKLVYVAHPLTGDEDENRKAARDYIKLLVVKKGDK